MHFTKMHGLGNDYLYVFGEVPDNIKDICIKLSDRHFGAGSDGMIYISRSDRADFKMRIFNADGSEAMMCGNGIRCVGKYVYEKGYTDNKVVTVDTLSGVKTLRLETVGRKVAGVAVGMGKASVGDFMTLDACGNSVSGTYVSVGNPHFVVFTDDVESVKLDDVGPAIEKQEAFPGGVNVEFVEVLGENRLRMRVWERGSGITLACGTGACASVSAAVSRGACRAGEPVAVVLDGGVLTVEVSSDYEITMTGPAQTVYEGEAQI